MGEFRGVFRVQTQPKINPFMLKQPKMHENTTKFNGNTKIPPIFAGSSLVLWQCWNVQQQYSQTVLGKNNQEQESHNKT